MDKWDYQNKPCYLENRVVRELCKRRTACITFFNVLSWNCTQRSFKYPGQVGSLMRVVKLSSSSSWTAAAVPKIKARLRLPTSTMKPPPQKLASNLCLHPILSVWSLVISLIVCSGFYLKHCGEVSNRAQLFWKKNHFQKSVANRQIR